MSLTRHRFTVDEYHRMGEAGIFREDDRVELIDGQVVEMTPIGPGHAACVKRQNRLWSQWSHRVIVGIQDPVVLGPHAAPQPDLAILRARADGYPRAHPGPEDVLLLIEVADRSADFDRHVKLPLYAAAGIPEVWIEDLPLGRIEVYREPQGDTYAGRRIVGRGGTLSPLGLPEATFATDDILG